MGQKTLSRPSLLFLSAATSIRSPDGGAIVYSTIHCNNNEIIIKEGES